MERPSPGTPLPAARIQYLRRAEDIDRIEFRDGLAAVEVPFELLDTLPLVNECRQPGPRLDRLVRSIRARGYSSPHPIVCRIGMKGRWVLVDGGHRITAARIVGRSCLANLFERKVRTLYFLLFTTAGSWKKVRAMVGDAAQDLPEAPPTGEPGGSGARES